MQQASSIIPAAAQRGGDLSQVTGEPRRQRVCHSSGCRVALLAFGGYLLGSDSLVFPLVKYILKS